MAHSAPSLHQLRFGVFTVDLQALELRKHGLRIRLQQLPFQLLVALLEKRNEVVTREELRELLWPNDTYVDFDHSISSAINKLRTALNDSARTPHYIETVGRRGYRFIYPVTEIAAPVKTTAPEVLPSARRSRKWQFALISVAGLVVLSLVVLFLWKPSPSPADQAIRSIAVLPLKNLSSDPEQEYFSEGLTDELITRLASIEGLRVTSRTSSLQYRNSNKPLREIAKQLHVDGVVEGSVLRAEGRVRITVQLVSAADDRPVWAQSYERDHRDVLAMQDDLSGDIAKRIHLSLDPEKRRSLASHAVNPDAYEAYLHARYYWARRNWKDIGTAVKYYEQAIALDPEYTLAYAGMAQCYALMSGYTQRPQDQFIPQARAAAVKALELDPNLAEAHIAQAVIAQNYDWDWKTAEKEYRRAIELEPSNATAHHWFGEFLSFQGRFPESMEEFERARQLDPMSSIIATDTGVALYYSREYDRAIAQLRSVLDRDPIFGRAYMIVFPYVQRGRIAEALADIQQWQRSTQSRVGLPELGYIYGRMGNRAAANEIIREIIRKGPRGERDPAAELEVYLGLGDKERAFAELEKGYHQHSTVLSSLKVNPAYDALRSDPRFDRLLRRVGLAP